MIKKNNAKKNSPVKKAAGGNKAGIVAGTLVGAALGAAAGMLLAPGSGKKLRNDIKNRSADFYRQMAPQLKKLRAVGESELNAFMGRAVKQYATAKKLTAAEQKALASEAMRSWGHVKKQLGKKKGK